MEKKKSEKMLKIFRIDSILETSFRYSGFRKVSVMSDYASSWRNKFFHFSNETFREDETHYPHCFRFRDLFVG
jgi:hypothetical protein